MRTIARFRTGGAHRARLQVLRDLAAATAATTADSPVAFVYDRWHATGPGSSGFYAVHAQDSPAAGQVFLDKGQAEVFAAGWICALIAGGENTPPLTALYERLLEHSPSEPALNHLTAVTSGSAAPMTFPTCGAPGAAFEAVAALGGLARGDMIGLRRGQVQVFALGWLAVLIANGDNGEEIRNMFTSLREQTKTVPLTAQPWAGTAAGTSPD
jgi:hypothetical protein